MARGNAGWTYIRAKQSLHSLSYVTPSVPQTGSYVRGQAGDSTMCSQMGCGREKGGHSGIQRQEVPRGSAWNRAEGVPGRSQIQEGPSVGPKSMKPSMQGPMARLLVCVCMCVCVCVCKRARLAMCGCRCVHKDAPVSAVYVCVCVCVCVCVHTRLTMCGCHCVHKDVPVSAEPKYAGYQVNTCLHGFTHSSQGLREILVLLRTQEEKQP